MFIAVVGRSENMDRYKENKAFTGPDKNKVVTTALRAKTTWEKDGQYGPYDVYVGELTEKVSFPVSFELVAISEPKPKEVTE